MLDLPRRTPGVEPAHFLEIERRAAVPILSGGHDAAPPFVDRHVIEDGVVEFEGVARLAHAERGIGGPVVPDGVGVKPMLAAPERVADVHVGGQGAGSLVVGKSARNLGARAAILAGIGSDHGAIERAEPAAAAGLRPVAASPAQEIEIAILERGDIAGALLDARGDEAVGEREGRCVFRERHRRGGGLLRGRARNKPEQRGGEEQPE